MRLWHKDLIPYLPRQQLLGQHRECCALRGKGWDKRHFVIDYIKNYSYFRLYNYHTKIMQEMTLRGYKISNDDWYDHSYRGQTLGIDYSQFTFATDFDYDDINLDYQEHCDVMLEENLNNLKYGLNDKGEVKNIDLFKHFPETHDLGKYDKTYWLNWYWDLGLRSCLK